MKKGDNVFFTVPAQQTVSLQGRVKRVSKELISIWIESGGYYLDIHVADIPPSLQGGNRGACNWFMHKLGWV